MSIPPLQIFFLFLVVVALTSLRLQTAKKKPPTDHCIHKIRPSHSPTTMPLLLLHHAFQGSPLCWDYEEEIHIFQLTLEPFAHLSLYTHADTGMHKKKKYEATIVVDKKLVSKSRWHIRVTPNLAWPLQCVKATRSMTSVLVMEDWSLSCSILLLVYNRMDSAALRHSQEAHMLKHCLLYFARSLLTWKEQTNKSSLTKCILDTVWSNN